MSDKVRQLAEKLWDRPFVCRAEMECVIRAELNPLLDAADKFLNARPFSIRHSDEGGALAAELEHWHSMERTPER